MKSNIYLALASILLLPVAAWLFVNVSDAWSDKVVVSAVVWPINATPSIISASPSDEPFLLSRMETQEFRITIFDREKDRINFTVTPTKGYVFPLSGKIMPTDFSTGSTAIVKFRYLAPFFETGDQSVTVTLSDGPNIVTKTVPIFVF